MANIEKLVGIHQPNFFPWLGFFDKICRSDIFILLDDVQFPKSGRGGWTNRVQVSDHGTPRWLTLPVDRTYQGLRNINEIQIANDPSWQQKIINALNAYYRRAPYWDEIFPIIQNCIAHPSKFLLDFNLHALFILLDHLGLDRSHLVLASNLSVSSKSTERLIDLINAVKGTAYYCGGGASGYQEDTQFALNSIALVYQNFQHPQYNQFLNRNNFVQGCSIIDVLFNLGFNDTKKLIAHQNIYE